MTVKYTKDDRSMYTRFELFGYSLPSYWTMFAVGLLVMVLINILRRKKVQFSAWRAVVYTMLCALFSLIGAKILYAAENWGQFLKNGPTLDGVSFFGSVFLLPAAMYLVCRWRRVPYRAFMDYCSPSLMAMLAILRLACWLNGCCGGITIQNGAYASVVVPTQIIECIGDLTILGVLLLVEWHYSGRGLLYPYILVLYGILRFVVEFFRDTPKDWLYLSHGQWFAIIAVCAGGYLLYTMMKKILEEEAQVRKKKRPAANQRKRKR